jgi:hypothetical protein
MRDGVSSKLWVATPSRPGYVVKLQGQADSSDDSTLAIFCPKLLEAQQTRLESVLDYYTVLYCTALLYSTNLTLLYSTLLYFTLLYSAIHLHSSTLLSYRVLISSLLYLHSSSNIYTPLLASLSSTLLYSSSPHKADRSLEKLHRSAKYIGRLTRRLRLHGCSTHSLTWYGIT